MDQKSKAEAVLESIEKPIVADAMTDEAAMKPRTRSCFVSFNRKDGSFSSGASDEVSEEDVSDEEEEGDSWIDDIGDEMTANFVKFNDFSHKKQDQEAAPTTAHFLGADAEQA